MVAVRFADRSGVSELCKGFWLKEKRGEMAIECRVETEVERMEERKDQ